MATRINGFGAEVKRDLSPVKQGCLTAHAHGLDGAGLDSLLASLGPVAGGTFSKSWDSVGGKYVFSFSGKVRGVNAVSDISDIPVTKDVCKCSLTVSSASAALGGDLNPGGSVRVIVTNETDGSATVSLPSGEVGGRSSVRFSSSVSIAASKSALLTFLYDGYKYFVISQAES